MARAVATTFLVFLCLAAFFFLPGCGASGNPSSSQNTAFGRSTVSGSATLDSISGDSAVPASPPATGGSGSSGSGGGNGGAIQSGTLTAGSFDDNLNFDVYKNFLSQMLQGDSAGILPKVSLGTRVVVLVQNDAGAPIGDARVVVTEPGAASAALLDLHTGTDGHVLFLTGLDGGATDNFTVTVYPPDGGNPVTQMDNLSETLWTVVLPGTPASLPTQLDLAFVVDATGSMGDELEYLKTEVKSIVDSISNQFPNVSQQYALIVYRDEGDDYVTRVFDFTGTLNDFQTQLASQRADGGGDYEEAVHKALEAAGGLTWRAGNTARVLFWIGDAPPHDPFAQRAFNAVLALRKAAITVYPVAASGADDRMEFFMRTAAFLTLGQYLFITDDSGVGESHAEPHIPCYWVERLNRLMIRMIASELAGKTLLPQSDEILRTVGNPPGPCTSQPAT